MSDYSDDDENETKEGYEDGSVTSGGTGHVSTLDGGREGGGAVRGGTRHVVRPETGGEGHEVGEVALLVNAGD